MSILYHSQSTEQVLKSLNTTKQGLSNQDAKNRLKENGPNTLPRSTEKVTRLKIFISQFTSPLIFILVIAGVVSAVLGDIIDATVIFITVAINSVVGFIQEDKANEALKKLRSMIEYHALVIREGHPKQIKSEEIVVGDILILEAGDKIQADGRILEETDLEINESALTGESEPNKKNTKILEKKLGMADRSNMVFRGTVAVNGRARVVVTAIGGDTEIGKIASLVKDTTDEKTPLQVQLNKMSKYLAIIILSISVLIFFVGVFFSNNGSILELFQVAVAMSVAAIPEGLVITLTVILAVGMRKILKRKALVRKLVAAETLGSVSVICTDKTGTITEGQMHVTRIITANDDLDFDEIQTLSIEKDDRHRDALFGLRIGVLNNDGVIENTEKPEEEWKLTGDSTDLAFLRIGAKIGLKKEYLDSAMRRVGEITFSSKRKYMATMHSIDHERVVYVKGAPDVLLKKCKYFEEEGKTKTMTEKQHNFFKKELNILAEDGLRTLAIAYKHTKKSSLSEEDVDDLVLVGIVGMSDPIRSDVRETIALAHKAKIKTVMITGDHARTAESIARQIGLDFNNAKVFDGQELEKMSDEELQASVKNISIFARVDPVHKIRIVRAFQANGDVVAMTGDGVNDAPALKAADIGVALGSGTDVAKEVADMVLLNDAYSTIVHSVEQGRGIYQNVRKVVLYLLSGSFAEVVLIGGSIISGLPLAVLPAQILWVNIIEDAFPNMALAFDKGDKENMSEGPRSKNEPLINEEIKTMIAIISIVSNLVLFGLFVYFLRATADLAKVRTLMFVGLGIDSLLYIYSVRSLRHHIWEINPFNNMYLNLALLFGWVMLVGAVYAPPLQILLRTVPLGNIEWVIMFGFGVLNIALIEIVKGVFLVRKNRQLAINN